MLRNRLLLYIIILGINISTVQAAWYDSAWSSITGLFSQARDAIASHYHQTGVSPRVAVAAGTTTLLGLGALYYYQKLLKEQQLREEDLREKKEVTKKADEEYFAKEEKKREEKKEKEIEQCAQEKAQWENKPFIWGYIAFQGARDYMEDYHVAKTDGKHSFFGIFDGHGLRPSYGHVVADAVANGTKNPSIESLWSIVSKELKGQSDGDRGSILTSAFKKMDDQFPFPGEQARYVSKISDLDEYAVSGTTATVALVDHEKINIAWVGDSRALMITEDGSLIATKDHKPNDPSEKERIEAAGGKVAEQKIRAISIYRVGGLAMSRSIGDKYLKKFLSGNENAIIATPEIKSLDLHNCRWLIIASDGVWDYLSNEEVAALLPKNLETKVDFTCLTTDFPFPEHPSYSNKKREYEGFTSMQVVAWNILFQAYNTGVRKGQLPDNLSVLVIRFDSAYQNKN